MISLTIAALYDTGRDRRQFHRDSDLIIRSSFPLSPMQSRCFPGSTLRAANTVVLLADKSSCIVPIIGTLDGQFNHYQQWNHRILGLEKPYRLLCCRPQGRGFYKCCFLLMLHVVLAEEDPLPSLKVLHAVIRSHSKYCL